MTASTVVQKNVKTAKTAAGRAPGWQTLLVWAAALALVAAGIWMRWHDLGLLFDRDGYDEGVYWQSLRAMSAGQTLYQPTFYSQPPFFLLSIFPTFMLFGQTLWAARLGIVLVSLLGFVGAMLLGKALAGRVGLLAALFLLVADPLYLAQSQSIQAEAPSAAFSLLAVGLAYLWFSQPEGVAGLWYAALCAITLALGILCKLLGVAAVVPVGLLMLAQLWKVWQRRGNDGQIEGDGKSEPTGTPGVPINRRGPTLEAGTSGVGRDWSRSRWRGDSRRFSGVGSVIVGVVAFILTLVVVILPFAGVFPQMMQQVVSFHLAAGVTFKSTQAGNSTMLLTALSSLTAGAALVGSIAALLRRDWRVFPLIAWFLATIYLLWQQVPLFPHHLVALVPPLVALAVVGIGPIKVEKSEYAIITNTTTAITLLVVLGAGLVSGYAAYHYLRLEHGQGTATATTQGLQVAQDLEAATRPDQLVITDAQFIAGLANRNTPASLVDTSMVHIQSGYLDAQQLIQQGEQPQVHAVLFYTGRLMLPDTVAFHTWVTQHFRLAHNYGGGKELWIKVL